MSDDRFADYVNRERDRLNGERESIRGEQRELEKKLREIDREMEAITAYESAKAGRGGKGQGRPSVGRQRSRRGSKREAIMDIIRQGNGLGRADILHRIGLKGDKSGEMSVSNALTALTKAGHVRREGGKYHPAQK